MFYESPSLCVPKDTDERSNLECVEKFNYKHNRLRSLGGWSGINPVDFCLGGTRNESRPGHCLTGLRFSVFFPLHTANVCVRPLPLPCNTFPIYRSQFHHSMLCAVGTESIESRQRKYCVDPYFRHLITRHFVMGVDRVENMWSVIFMPS